MSRTFEPKFKMFSTETKLVLLNDFEVIYNNFRKAKKIKETIVTTADLFIYSSIKADSIKSSLLKSQKLTNSNGD